ncbi:twin-arginine translocase TatA/TatE family subunit [Actinotalea sp. Marseille-Q4924]|uniref:twin-arginine translocase TatA/TatE family subunit n=1 Tax=Actinotalea sp. Marseille-Q4924 TaxID=2866571 RepID=UPI001CE45C84|nr:twin-arginine translocase TatA/TatE family subunit [Actinotalea sp. Marseille-Q4924]
MFGINGGEVLVLLLVALVVVGPERLPRYAEQLGGWVRQLRGFVRTAKERVAEEMGEEGADVDWSQLDPRRYDPRRIVREALLDDEPPPVLGRRYTSGATRRVSPSGAAGAAGAVGVAAAGRARTSAAGDVAGADAEGAGDAYVPPPFDPDAT